MSTLNPGQLAFATSREPFPALVAGFGAGKTAAGIARAMALKAHFREADVAYYLPTYPLVEDIAYQRIPELCERKGWSYKLHKGSAPYIGFPGAGRIILRTMEKPERIIGYEVGHSLVDELDTLPQEKAQKVWEKIIARNRKKLKGGFPNTVGVVTTPEGFKFVWKRWVKLKRPGDGYALFRARTMDNAANLPADYIDNLRNTYAGPLLQAYLEGEFVNLTASAVYPAFNRVTNFTNARIKEGEALHIGMDFNVTKMAAIVHVVRDGKPHAVQEFTDVFDTPAMVKLLQERYINITKPHQINIYPDASGNSRKSVDASKSDIALLKQGGFKVWNNPTNPAVRDRILSMNKMLGMTDYKVNPDTCPVYTEALEKQAYDKNGEPDKDSGFDHPIDAGGYFITYKYPVIKRLVGNDPLKV